MTNNKQQTAVDAEELAMKLYPFSNSERNAFITGYNKAKEMEKEHKHKFTIAFMAWLYNNEYYYKRKQKMYLKSWINESKFFTIEELMIEFNKIQ
jgi:hypothetical protein